MAQDSILPKAANSCATQGVREGAGCPRRVGAIGEVGPPEVTRPGSRSDGTGERPGDLDGQSAGRAVLDADAATYGRHVAADDPQPHAESLLVGRPRAAVVPRPPVVALLEDTLEFLGGGAGPRVAYLQDGHTAGPPD